MRYVPMLLLLLMTSRGAAQEVPTGFLDRTVEVQGTSFKYQVYVPAGYSAEREWPVILFLHGSGERGNDGLRQTMIALGASIRAKAERYPAIVVFPQVPPQSTWTGLPADAAMAALDEVLGQYRTDANRVYLTGLSMGGQGTWYLAYRHAERFAAIAPVCGWVSPRTTMAAAQAVVPDADGDHFERLAARLKDKPLWIFHGENDSTVPVSESRNAFAALQRAGADVRYTELPGTGHNAWDPAYNSDAFADWLFEQQL